MRRTNLMAVYHVGDQEVIFISKGWENFQDAKRASSLSFSYILKQARSNTKK